MADKELVALPLASARSNPAPDLQSRKSPDVRAPVMFDGAPMASDRSPPRLAPMPRETLRETGAG
jgi:hypothetical protein